MQTKAYSELKSLIKALAGVNAFTTAELTDILNFVNRRYYQAYNASRSWPRYIVVGEERTITSPQTITYSETNKNTISEFLRIHKSQPFLNSSALEFEFYLDEVGAHILNISSSTPSAFVTYRKEFTSIDGNDSDLIPLEFFDFIAHASYADFLRLDSQHSKALVEENIAKQYLENELIKVDISMNNSTINKRFSTYVGYQPR